MDIVVVAGLWLDGSAWDEVLPALSGHGHRVRAVTLPGQGDGTTTATLDDQLAAVVAAVDEATGPVLVVGHSAASALAWLAADRRTDVVAGAALIGGYPKPEGETYADFFEPVDGVVAFPGWGPFEGPDIDDLDAPTRDRVAASAVTVPEQVTRGTVTYTDERRRDVPLVMVCPEYTPEQAKEWVASGELPEVAAARRVSYVDIDSGHWPMFSKPAELADVLDEVARSLA